MVLNYPSRDPVRGGGLRRGHQTVSEHSGGLQPKEQHVELHRRDGHEAQRGGYVRVCVYLRVCVVGVIFPSELVEFCCEHSCRSAVGTVRGSASRKGKARPSACVMSQP